MKPTLAEVFTEEHCQEDLYLLLHLVTEFIGLESKQNWFRESVEKLDRC